MSSRRSASSATSSRMWPAIRRSDGDRRAGRRCPPFEPKPDQIAALADADLIFENGIGFETWLDDMYEASGSSATRVVVTDGLPLLEFNGQGDAGDSGHERRRPRRRRARSSCLAGCQQRDLRGGAIRDATDCRRSGQCRYLHRQCRRLYHAASGSRHHDQADGRTIPAEKRILVTSHDSLGYFATPTASPSPGPPSDRFRPRRPIPPPARLPS